MPAIGEFFIKMGLDIDKASFSSLDRSLSSMGKAANLAPEALAATYRYLDDIVKKASQLYINISNINKQTGLNTQAMLEYQNVARMANPNLGADEVINSLSTIQQKLIQIKWFGGKDYKPFQLLGLQVYGQDAIGILEQLRKVAKQPEFQGMGKGAFSYLAEQVGVTPDMINMLQLSDEAYDKYKKTALLHKDDQETVKALRYEFNRVNIELGYLGSQIVAVLSPALSFVLDLVKTLMKDAEWFIPKLKEAGKWLKEHEGYLQAIKVAVGVILLALFPIWSLFLLIGLAIEDIMTQLRGGKSIFEPMRKAGDYLVDSLLKAKAIYEKMFGTKAQIIDTLGMLSNKEEAKEWGKMLGVSNEPYTTKEPPSMKKDPFNAFFPAGTLDWLHGLDKEKKEPLGKSILQNATDKSNAPFLPTNNQTTNNATFNVTGDNPKEIGQEAIRMWTKYTRMQLQTSGTN